MRTFSRIAKWRLQKQKIEETFTDEATKAISNHANDRGRIHISLYIDQKQISYGLKKFRFSTFYRS